MFAAAATREMGFLDSLVSRQSHMQRTHNIVVAGLVGSLLSIAVLAEPTRVPRWLINESM